MQGQIENDNHCDKGLGILKANLHRLDLAIPDLNHRIKEWSISQPALPEMLAMRDLHTAAVRPLIEKLRCQGYGPILLEGISPPWILKSLIDTPPPESTLGFRQRIIVLQRDWNEFFNGLAITDLGDELGSDRIEWFVGENAPDRLLAWFEDRITDCPPAFAIQNPQLRQKSTPDVNALLRQMTEQFDRNEASLIRALRDQETHDNAWWAQRYESISESEPLRVLVTVSRFTTYLRHIATDLANAFQAMGSECQIVIERDDSTKMSTSSLLQELNRFQPHLIVSINYTRSMLGDQVPRHIPHVCWIQDTMPHLYSKQVGDQMGERDFIVGMVKPELTSRFGYPPGRTRSLPMCAARSKFSKSIANDGFDAEICWATHQSEAPSIMKRKMLDTLAKQSPQSVDRIGSLLDEVERTVLQLSNERVHHLLEKLLDTALFPAEIPEAAHEARSHILNTIVVPYAERVYRHQTAEWAAEISRERGWRFRLHGHGWEQHPTLSSFAAGPLEHGEQIRDAYRRSAVHLHASINQTLHQRVVECVLSGGLPLCRITHQSMYTPYKLLASQAKPLARELTSFDPDHPNSPWFVSAHDNALAAAYIDIMIRFGYEPDKRYKDSCVRWQKRRIERYREEMQDNAALAQAQLFSCMLGQFFTSRDTLANLLEVAIENRQKRSDQIAQLQEAIPEIMTTEGFAKELIEMIRLELSNQATT